MLNIFFTMWIITLKVIEGQISPLYLRSLSTVIYKPSLIEISINANTMKTNSFHKGKYDLKGHTRPLIEISINANTMKTNSFHKGKYDLKGHTRPLLCYWEVSCFLKTFRSFDRTTALTYFLKVTYVLASRYI